jgi:hypothetical protein
MKFYICLFFNHKIFHILKYKLIIEIKDIIYNLTFKFIYFLINF